MAERPGMARAWGVVLIFLFFFVLSFINRTIISMMVEPIEKHLRLSDFEMSLLLGPAFSLPYLIFCLPMGWLVDRLRTGRLLGGGIAVWGVSTLACGLAVRFLPFIAARMGVGIGEAVLTPAAHATIAQRFPQRRLALAMSVYTLGASIGAGLALALGGIVVHLAASEGARFAVPPFGLLQPWQFVFLAVGGLTIAALPLVLLIPDARGAGPAEASDHDGESFGAIFRRHWRYFLLMPLGFACINVINSAYSAWVPTFMIRSYGWNAAEVGTAWGMQHLIAISGGQILNATIIDRLYARGLGNAHALYPVVALLVSLPAIVWAFLSGGGWAFVLLSGIFFLLAIPFVGYASAAMQLFTPTRWRGRMSALYTAIVVGIAPSIGSPIVGWLSDHVFGKEDLGASLLVLTLVFAPMAMLILFVAGREMKRLHATTRPATI